MKLEEVQSEADMLEYIKGLLYDFESGIADQNETEWSIINLVLWCVKRDRTNQENKMKSKV